MCCINLIFLGSAIWLHFAQSMVILHSATSLVFHRIEPRILKLKDSFLVYIVHPPKPNLGFQWVCWLFVSLKFWLVNQGILPDVMHIMALSLYPDAFCSVMLDLTDNQEIIRGSSRDARLDTLWLSYRQWCEQEGMTVKKHIL